MPHRYRQFIHAAGIDSFMRSTLDGLDVNDIDRLQHVGAEVRGAILASEVCVGGGGDA